jgi:glutamate dehydrogenase
MGLTFVFRVQEEMEVDIATIIRTWDQAANALDSERLFVEIEALDNRISVDVQYDMLLNVQRQLERVTRWILNLALTEQNIFALFDTLKAHLPAQLSLVGRWLKKSARHLAIVEEWTNAGVPEKQAKFIACLDVVIPLLHAAQIAKHYNYSIDETTRLYFKMAQLIRLDWLTNLIDALPRHNRWQTLARLACRHDLYQGHSQLVERILQFGQIDTVDKMLSRWTAANEASIAHCRQLFEELEQSTPDLAMISAAIREITQRLGVGPTLE